MPIWTWEERFTDVRVCGVEADTLEEAKAKREAGDWLFEDTVSFYSEERVEELTLLEE